MLVKYYFSHLVFTPCQNYPCRKMRQKVASKKTVLCKQICCRFIPNSAFFSLGKTLWNLGKTLLCQRFFPIYSQGFPLSNFQKKYGYFWLCTGYVPDLFFSFLIYFVKKVYILSPFVPLAHPFSWPTSKYLCVFHKFLCRMFFLRREILCIHIVCKNMPFGEDICKVK
jgi:hypothetical protein